jgi:hypothetical protein
MKVIISKIFYICLKESSKKRAESGVFFYLIGPDIGRALILRRLFIEKFIRNVDEPACQGNLVIAVKSQMFSQFSIRDAIIDRAAKSSPNDKTKLAVSEIRKKRLIFRQLI